TINDCGADALIGGNLPQPIIVEARVLAPISRIAVRDDLCFSRIIEAHGYGGAHREEVLHPCFLGPGERELQACFLAARGSQGPKRSTLLPPTPVPPD
ncbi:hypothetical protein KXX50_008554, partial [Aspergillus fumigatus]